MANETQKPKSISGKCPSCAYNGKFKYIGSQTWPVEVAEKLGVPAEIALYQCENCLTTISEPMLLKSE